MTSTWKNINISPSPGFCVKSKLLHPGFLNRVALPQGLKVFVNVAWSKDVPPPLNSVKKTLELATATSTGDHQTLSDNGGDIPIYIFVSDGRLDTDKAGNPSVVFDCIYHSLFKSHVLKDADVKKLLIEHALKQIEVQNTFSLSRTLGKPNITSKGALEQRIVSIPAELFPKDRHRDVSPGNTSTKRLVEEVPVSTGREIFIPLIHLKDSRSFTEVLPSVLPGRGRKKIKTFLSRSKFRDLYALGFLIFLLRLHHNIFQTHATIASATLDIEPRRLTLVVPGLYGLDIDLNLSDSALGRALFPTGTSPQEVEHALLLKRDRNLDVEGARAEWRRKEGSLVIMA